MFLFLDLGLDCESVSISSSTSGTRRGQIRGGVARQILGMTIPGIKNPSRGTSLEKTVMEDIPEQLRTPKIPQVSFYILLFTYKCFKHTMKKGYQQIRGNSMS